MPKILAETSVLLVIDLQARLMPAIHEGATVVANAARLLAAARQLEVPVMATEQNPRGLGPTVPELGLGGDVPVVSKMSFDACSAPGFFACLPTRHAIIVAGCEAHVCVLQTVLGLRALGRDVYVVADAIGARTAASKAAAVARMERHGAEIVTTEMAIFEWLGDATHPRFREAVALIK